MASEIGERASERERETEREREMEMKKLVSLDTQLAVLLNIFGCDSPGIFRSGSLITIIVLSSSRILIVVADRKATKHEKPRIPHESSKLLAAMRDDRSHL